MEPLSSIYVEISTTAGHTWITAPDSGVARLVRATAAVAGCRVGSLIQGGRVVDQVVDLSTGIDAMAACEALAAIGLRFRWHSEQDPDVRQGGWEHELPGMYDPRW